MNNYYIISPFLLPLLLPPPSFRERERREREREREKDKEKERERERERKRKRKRERRESYFCLDGKGESLNNDAIDDIGNDR
jgi:hypothetical protein